MRACLAALAGAEADPNATLAAIGPARTRSRPGLDGDGRPCRSPRPGSGRPRPSPPGTLRDLGGRCTWDAPEFLAPGRTPGRPARVRGTAWPEQGRRVVLPGDRRPASSRATSCPTELVPRALVLLEDDIRPDAQEILDYFSEQGVDAEGHLGGPPGHRGRRRPAGRGARRRGGGRRPRAARRHRAAGRGPRATPCSGRVTPPPEAGHGRGAAGPRPRGGHDRRRRERRAGPQGRGHGHRHGRRVRRQPGRGAAGAAGRPVLRAAGVPSPRAAGSSTAWSGPPTCSSTAPSTRCSCRW